MIESKCECCGGKILLPDPPPLTQEQKVATRKRWDEAVEKKSKVVTYRI